MAAVEAPKEHANTSLVPPDSDEDAHQAHTGNLVRLVLMPKSMDNPFFDPSGEGCRDHAALLTNQGKGSGMNVTCTYAGPPADADDNSGELQAQMIRELVANKSMDGLAVAVRSVEVVGPAIEEAIQAGIPVVTFDSDAPNSGRLCYVGTDNYFFGTQIGKLLKQLKPNGGTFTALYSAESLNLQQRVQGFMDELEREPGVWTHLGTADVQSNITKAMEDMHAFANLDPPPTAIGPVMGMPMRSGTWKQFVDEHAHKNITLVSGDAMANQIEFLERGYVHGLVGQLPYDFGAISAQTLYDAIVHEKPPPSDVIGTNVITLVQVPLVLPPLDVDNNILDHFHWVGFILFGIIVILAFGFATWTYIQRKINAVRVAQPMFLGMVCCGAIVLASALVPLSFDDDGYPDTLSESESVTICMSVPWLASTGFTMTFSALFAKTWRVNRIFHRSKNSFTRVTVTVQDVLIPFFVLLGLNTLILALWTALDPLTFVRKDLPGTDGWNRVIATYGTCQSNNGIAFLVPLAVVNLSVLVLANWQAYQARVIQSEFSESKYIGIAMASLLQSMLSGIPILIVVRESPQAYYLVLSFMIFIICAVVLLVIFVPKMVMVEKFSNETPSQQKKRILSSIRQSRHSIMNKSNTGSGPLSLQYSDGNGSRQFSFHTDGHDSSRFMDFRGDKGSDEEEQQGQHQTEDQIQQQSVFKNNLDDCPGNPIRRSAIRTGDDALRRESRDSNSSNGDKENPLSIIFDLTESSSPEVHEKESREKKYNNNEAEEIAQTESESLPRLTRQIQNEAVARSDGDSHRDDPSDESTIRFKLE